MTSAYGLVYSGKLHVETLLAAELECNACGKSTGLGADNRCLYCGAQARPVQAATS